MRKNVDNPLKAINISQILEEISVAKRKIIQYNIQAFAEYEQTRICGMWSDRWIGKHILY